MVRGVMVSSSPQNMSPAQFVKRQKIHNTRDNLQKEGQTDINVEDTPLRKVIGKDAIRGLILWKALRMLLMDEGHPRITVKVNMRKPLTSEEDQMICIRMSVIDQGGQ